MFSAPHTKGPNPQPVWGAHLQPTKGSVYDYPLIHACCVAELRDVHLTLNLEHAFQCTVGDPSDVSYVFPVPPDAAVHAFHVEVNGRELEGVVREKAMAKAEFEQALSQNRSAALLQQENVEIFKLMIGNVQQGQEVVVRISLSSIIPSEPSLDSFRLTFPTSIAPRYGKPPGGSFYRSATMVSNSSMLEFYLVLEATAHITAVNSPSHPIAAVLGRSTMQDAADFDPTKAFVSLTSPTFLDKDIVIVVSSRGLDKQRCVVETWGPEDGNPDGYSHAYMLTFVPRFPLPMLQQQEYIFLVDQSGSMEGAKMDKMRGALQVMLKSLPAHGTLFNLISFGSHQLPLFPTSMHYTAGAVAHASAHVDAMAANFGGTEMKAAINTAIGSRTANADHGSWGLQLGRPAGAGPIPTSVFILTDGQCYDLEGVNSTIRHACAKARRQGPGSFLRVFCMGIGDAVSRAMCNTIARAGGGAAVFVGENERPDQKLMGLLRAAQGPPVENLCVDWGVSESLDRSPSTDSSTGSDWSIPTPPPPFEGASMNSPMSLFDEQYYPNQAGLGFPTLGPVSSPAPPKLQEAPAPALIPGFRITWLALVRSGRMPSPPSGVIRVTAHVGNQPLALEAPVIPLEDSNMPYDLPHIPHRRNGAAPPLHRAAAHALIEGLEDVACTQPSDASHREIVRLGTTYDLASSQTSFVAVDKHNGMPWAFVGEETPMYGGPVVGSAFGGLPPPTGMGFAGFKSRGARKQATDPAPTSPPEVHKFGRSATMPSPTSMSTAARQIAGSISTGSEDYFKPAVPTIVTHGRDDSPVPASPLASSPTSPIFSSPPLYAPQPKTRSPLVPGFAFSRRSVKLSALIGVTDSATATADAAPPAKAPKAEETDTDRQPTPYLGLDSSVATFARIQSFDGSFLGTPKLFHLLFNQPVAPKVPESLQEVSISEEAKNTIWCTVLCLAYLAIHFADERDVWDIMNSRAIHWVQDTLNTTTADSATVLAGIQKNASTALQNSRN